MVATCNCFAEGTEVDTICGPLPIEEITTGDRVVSVDLETALPAPTFLDRPARRCRLAKHAAMAVVPAMMAACVPDVGPLPHPMAVVEVYNPRTGSWLPGTGGQLAAGDEVLHEGHLLHITASGAEDRGPAERRDLVLADGTWMGGDSVLVPGAGDWVRVLGDGPTSGHWLLEDLQAGMSFAYAGRVFEADIVEGALLVTPTERVLSRVVFPFERVAEGLIEAEVAYDDGTVEVVEATPDHPFRSGEQWLPLGELEVGASLHVDRGSAVLVSKTWRQGDVEVFNFGVKGTHNYVVASRSVLVHNACDIPGASPGGPQLGGVVEIGPGMSVRNTYAITPGPFAGESIPARGPGRDFTPGERAEIDRIGSETGCHTCGTTDPGTRSGNFVPDHQPPNVLSDGGPQELMPQCIGCSRTQGGQLANRP